MRDFLSSEIQERQATRLEVVWCARVVCIPHSHQAHEPVAGAAVGTLKAQ